MTYEDTINAIKDGQIKTSLNGIKRRLWPTYCYHFTNIDNALNIIESGKIYSRNAARQKNLMKNEDANTDIIHNTNDNILNYVRLYFRPQVPMLYDTEGFRANDAYHYKHVKCPFPVYFLFDLSKVLNLRNCYFSPVSLAVDPRYRHNSLTSGPYAFSQLPFNYIYNDIRSKNWSSKKYEYIHSEQAEVVVKNYLSLDLLSAIVVRSHAEADTLKQLMKGHHVYKYLDKVRIDENNIFFNKQWSYVNDVFMEPNSINISMHIGENAFPHSWSNSQHPINPQDTNKYVDYRIVLRNDVNKWYWPTNGQKCLLWPKLHLNITNMTKTSNNKSYEMIIYLNNRLAYYGRFIPDYHMLPF